jgi:glycosyltransferase involved in cell wall biosynthesis
MPRIVYCAVPSGGVSGGVKMFLRHVETLRELGFDAHLTIGTQSKAPAWLDHRVQIEVGANFRPDDVIVLGDDMHDSIRRAYDMPQRLVIFSQSWIIPAALSYDAFDGFPEGRFPPFIAVAPALADTIRRAYPQAQVDVVPAFADERIFRPAPDAEPAIAFSPRKRRIEAAAIRGFFRKIHPRHAGLPWREVTDLHEREVARIFASSRLFLSLSRVESVGMTPLEAMACGAICAGFTGVGGRQFATAENGFWVGEDECEAAADALAAAADLDEAGRARMREAGFETARQWSYARFRPALEAAWMKLAPEARLKDGPLD